MEWRHSSLLFIFLSVLSEVSGASKRYQLPADVFQIPLDPENSVQFYWAVDYGKSQVQIEVHAPMNVTWIGIGFSDRGELTNADFCLFYKSANGQYTCVDTFTDDKGFLLKDSQSQDCLSAKTLTSKNSLKIAFVRKFDTNDDQDYHIEEGTTHIVWALGYNPLRSINNILSSSDKQGFQRTQLLKNTQVIAPLPKSAWLLDARPKESVLIPNLETTYWCQVMELPKDLEMDHHVVGFKAVIQEGNEALVHHMELFHCVSEPGTVIPLYKGPCDSPNRPEKTQVCKRVIAAWAMGATPFMYPPAAGLPVGGKQYNLYAMLEVHYNNPSKLEGVLDRSGLAVYVTKELRPNDAGVIELGLEYIDKMAIPPGQQLFSLSGYCNADCTGVGIPPQGITVFASQLHTHLTGVRVFTSHLRNGELMAELNRDNHYSTHFQEIRLLKNFTHVLPGDDLVTTCWYNTEERTDITLGGFAISDEMCVNYIYYYPKCDLEVCKSSIDDDALKDYFDVMREEENQSTGGSLPISQAYRSIDWTPARVKILEKYYYESDIYMQCNRSSGARFPGDWSHSPTPRLGIYMNMFSPNIADLYEPTN